MILKKITFDFPEMEKLNLLAQEAFPIEEYIAPMELIKMSQKNDLDVWALYDEKTFVGFMVTVVYQKMAYLFFLAIDSSCRSKGYGSAALSEFSKKYSTCQQVVDMEMLDQAAANKEQRILRKRFYLRNGYKESEHYLTYFGVSYEVLYKGDVFDFGMFKEMLRHIPINGFNPRFFTKE